MRGWKPFGVLLALVLALGLVGCGVLPGGEGSGGDSDSDAATSGGSSGETVAVTLSWDEDVDLDLEIWDAAGREALARPYVFGGDDVDDGSDDEEFEFKDYTTESTGEMTSDFSSGTFVVSVFYALRPSDSGADSVEATLEVRKADGSTETRTGVVFYDAAEGDQWHAFSVDATTGDITDIDEYPTTTVE